ncbi:flavin-containing monooxygenase [Gemmobacter denitrificans]|uniref:NAD(P)/FAD-dependent oxidoreductase n=1 Tax=Gemmobacter denitrificans TaxID=3123040 RepID=A0ABU8BYS6_9RHOB
MMTEQTNVVVVGAGQAGIAMSEHLTRAGVPHLVLERDRIAERWRSCRWDSLVMNGPAWHDRFPGQLFTGDPESFPGKEAVADYLVDYAAGFDAPIRCGVTVHRVARRDAAAGFVVETSAGPIVADYVVAATGAFQTPLIPPLVPETAGLMQLHSNSYRNPAQLPPGGVLVVGAGSSGAQIAEELLESGRQVWLSVGPHDRPPRRYRGRDFVWWLGVLNLWDADAPKGAEHTTIAVSGAHGGRTVDFRDLAARGMVLLGRAESCDRGVMHFAPDLRRNVERGDANLLALLDEADAWAARNGLDLPPDPEARKIGPDPACMVTPIATLDLAAAGITTILWATGFTSDYRWLPPGALDAQGRPHHQRGVAAEPGIYFLGLPYQSRRGSAFIWGVWHDAKFVADHILKQRSYLAYPGPARAAE